MDNFQISIELFPYNYLNLRFMGKVDRILRKMYPGRESFTDEERKLAEAALYVANSDAPKSRMPRKDIAVGGMVMKNGIRYRCVLRPEILSPADACGGCGLKDRPCSGLRCSSFDRTDGLNVWFQEDGLW